MSDEESFAKLFIKAATATVANPQCGATYCTAGGSVTFCVRRPTEHEGNHRGAGVEWTRSGTRVSPPTLNERGEPKKAKRSTETP